MDFSSIGALTIPVLFPIITELGFNPIWFGVFCVFAGELALVTPPVGMNIFVIKGVSPEININTIYRGVLPFLLALFVLFLILLYVPQIATFLPDIMMGT